MNSFEAIAQMVVEQAQKTGNIVEGDYLGEDNFYYCGKCHTRKQTIFSGLGEPMLVRCLCKCEGEAYEAEEKARKQRELVLRLRKRGFPEPSMQEWTFANDDGSNPKMTQAMKNYVEHFDTFKEEGRGLMLFGTTGTGKTYLAACAANALINKGIPCLVTNIKRIKNELQDRFEGRQRYLDNLNSFPLLVLDDLGAESKTDYVQDIVYEVIDSRYRANLPIIITTNLTREELLNPESIKQQRIYSRLFEMCTPIEVVGKDRRQAALKEDIGKMKNLLGLE